MATRGKTWSDDEVQVMLGIWGDASVQRQLKGTVRNSHVFDKIVKELASKGYQRDEKQCREKLKQLKKKYKEVADSLRRSGAGVDSDDEFEESGNYVNFKFFSEIHSVMRGRPSVSPPALLDTSATGFRIPEERSSTSTSHTATPVESLVAADNPEGAESVGPVAMSEQAVEQDQSADGPGPSGISAPGSSEQPRPEEGEPLKKKKRKLNKLERVEKSMQKMIDSFLASEEKGRREFIELEKKKMEMENEAARNAAIREERFLQVMQQTILMARQPTPAPSLAQPQPNSGMYHFDLPVCNQQEDDD